MLEQLRDAVRHVLLSLGGRGTSLTLLISALYVVLAAGCGPGEGKVYHASSTGQGPMCGFKDGALLRCDIGSYCTSMDSNRCKTGGKRYEAYSQAGGPPCGADRDGNDVQCKRGSTCISEENNECEK